MNRIHVSDFHTGGEPTRVVIGGSALLLDEAGPFCRGIR
jgi:proline racemase